jgi:hypothetical protein
MLSGFMEIRKDRDIQAGMMDQGAVALTGFHQDRRSAHGPRGFQIAE